MTTKLRQAIGAALQALEDTGQIAAAQLLQDALQNEHREQAKEDAVDNGWSMELERPVGERVNPKVFSGKTIYNSWMNEEGITVIFQDFTKYVINGPNYRDIKRIQ